MSYILDALRRADAERERSGVPALDGQAAELVDDESEPQVQTPAWAWALLGGASVVGMVLLWQWLAHDEPVPAPPPLAMAPTAPVPAPPPPAPPPAVPPQAMETIPAAPKPAGRTVPTPKPVARAAADAFATNEGATPPGNKTPKLAQLPEDFRRGLPPLVIAGSTYSPVPSARMLIVNGQVQHEGDEVAPGVTIKQIRLRSAVFEARGQRFEVGF